MRLLLGVLHMKWWVRALVAVLRSHAAACVGDEPRLWFWYILFAGEVWEDIYETRVLHRLLWDRNRTGAMEGTTVTNKTTNSVALVREQTLPPSNPRLSAKIVPAFSHEECSVVCATDPHGRILGFLNRCRYYFLQVAQVCSRVWVDPIPDPLLLVASGIEPGT
jgi:hypothetical protein